MVVAQPVGPKHFSSFPSPLLSSPLLSANVKWRSVVAGKASTLSPFWTARLHYLAKFLVSARRKLETVKFCATY